MKSKLAVMCIFLLLGAAPASGRDALGPSGSDTQGALPDPLTMQIDVRDAARFAAVLRRTNGKPSAVDIQEGYLNGARRGVEIFTPHRIESAENLAAAVARDPARFAYAAETCLPWVASLESEMRAVYFAYRGLVPERQLPAIYVVFGASNSGGTAKPDAQVIGLEVMCAPGTTKEAFRDGMRRIFAHETVHSWQGEPTVAAFSDALLFMALREGVPDFLAYLVTGLEPSPQRADWGKSNEAANWASFQSDRAVVKAGRRGDWDMDDAAKAAFAKWFGNVGRAPAGIPDEAGYWVGMQIAKAYYERATDKRAAVRTLISSADPVEILAASGYAPTVGR